jgi:hypothetical protein
LRRRFLVLARSRRQRAPARWREQLYELLLAFHGVFLARRDAALAGLGRIPTSPKTLRAGEAMVAIMRAGGLSDRVIALGLDQLILYVSASAFKQGLYEHGDDRLRFGIDALIAGLEAVDRRG